MLNNASSRTADSSQSDNALMLAYRTGDFSAFEVLYRRYNNELFTYFAKGTGDEARARELFQDVWMSVVQRRDTYRRSARFSVWLYTLAHKRLTDHDRYLSTLKVTQKWVAPRVSGIAWPLQAQEITVFSQDDQGLVSAIQRLPAMQRDILLMRQIWRLKLDDIAHIMEQPLDLLKSRLRYANNRLRLIVRGVE